MNTLNNPYVGLLEVIRGDRKESGCRIFEGCVLSVSPLQIQAAGLLLDSEDLCVNGGLDLSVGDETLLITDDCQTFYVICALGG